MSSFETGRTGIALHASM